MNKQYFGILLAAFTLTGALSASAGDDRLRNDLSPQDLDAAFSAELAPEKEKETQQQTIFSIPQLSQEEVLNYRKKIVRHAKTINTTRVAAYSAGLAGIGYFTYRWLRNPAKDAVLKEEYDKLQKETAQLKTQVSELRGERVAALPPLTWGSWALSKVAALKNYALALSPDFFKTFVLSQVSGLVIGSMPHIGASLTFNPSLKWALEEHTGYVETLQAYMNWYQRIAMVAQDSDHFYFLWSDLKKEYALTTKQLVTATEKLLGYMMYIHDLVRPEELELRARVEVTADSIVHDTNNLIGLINSFLAVDNKEVTGDMLAELLKEWQALEFTILGHLENFEFVTHSLAFVDRDQRTGKVLRGYCSDLKRWIVPQFQGHAPRSENPRQLSEGEFIGQQVLTQGMSDILS